MQVSDVTNTALEKLGIYEIKNPEDLDDIGEKLVVFSPEMEKKKKDFKRLLFDKLYNHYRVIRMSRKASRFLRALFETYVNNPKQLPPQYFSHIKQRGKYEVICDYLAGMTDRYALDQYKNLFEPYERV
jgi:dGTPase